jgi:HEAT repeat protein
MAKAAFDQKIEAIRALRGQGTAALPALKKALSDRSNYLVAQAAAAAQGEQLSALIPDLLDAYPRFYDDPVKSDPQCWAKLAIVNALRRLGHRDPDPYIRGIQHIQLEPTWGRSEDSAGPLRGACALALVDSLLDDHSTLRWLVDRLADCNPQVRGDAAAALAQMGRPESVLLLRLKARLGDEAPEVLGQCFTYLLDLDPRESIGFVASFLTHPGDEIPGEAASALAQAKDPAAIQPLRTLWSTPLTPRFRVGLVGVLGGSPLREAADFLLEILRDARGEVAVAAVRALAAGRYRHEVAPHAEELLTEKESSLRVEFRRALDSAG